MFEKRHGVLTRRGGGCRRVRMFLPFILLVVLLTVPFGAAAFGFTFSKMPVLGSDTSDGKFAISNVQVDDAVRDSYAAPSGPAYDETKYQEYLFDYSLCSSAVISSVTVTVNWMVKRTTAAKIEVFGSSQTAVSYDLGADGRNGEMTNTISVTNIASPADINALKIRFLASGGTAPAVDFVQVTVTYQDANVCISPDNYSYASQGTTASYGHLVSAASGSVVSLASASRNGWTRRLYPDANRDGIKDNNTPITQVTVGSGGYTGVVAETDVPAGFNGSDTMTLTATLASFSRSSTDTTTTPADGLREPEYSAPYATRKLFDYGPDPNRASGELLSYVKDGLLHVYYAQNPRNINDNSYGTWEQYGWGTAQHTLNPDLAISDKTEFVFYDENGNIKLDFFSDYVSVVTATAQYPGGYHSCGFQTPCSDGSASDGSIMINNTVMSDADLARYMSIESSAAYNINRYTPTVGGNTSVNCGTYGNVDLKLSSPPINRRTYELYCPAASDFIFDYAIEVVLPIAKIFPNEPVINIVARAHNSPNKNNDRDNPPTPSVASLGDYVWYDLNGDGAQNSWETGIPNVRVVLYWDKNGDGVFSDGEELFETQTDSKGYYLFTGLYGGKYYSTKEGVWVYSGDYKVWVDETTIPPGFVRSTPNPYVLSDTIPGANRGTLGYDENCRTADFGYKPVGGVIGDFVWYDADRDGTEDNGELGLSGVTLDLLDANGQAIASTQTNSQGRYYFTGLDAGTYKVAVTDTGGVLTGYTHTIGNQSQTSPTPDIPLAVNQVYLNADFGYYNPALCASGDIAGKVFFDQNWNRVFDGTDSGLAGVVVSIWRDTNGNGLRDTTDEFVGSVTTDSGGNYHFYGLPVSGGGTTYILQVASQLTGLDKFYPSDGLTATLTTGVCTSSLNFPYVAAGAVGDFVWNDLNNNGIQDNGEPGIEGVTIQAQYCDPSTPPPGCSNTFTYATTTDSTGHYMFSGLRTADTGGSRYRISVTDTGSVLSGWNASPQLQGGDRTVDSDNPAATDVLIGDIYPKSDTTIDFGYSKPGTVFGSIGDYVWNDENGDGLQNEGPGYGFDNVTLDLRDANGVTIATTTTSSDGAYLFQGLPVSDTGISYHVVVTDLNGVLSGYSMTTNPEALNVTLTTAAPDILTADAGYEYVATKAVLSSFRAYNDGGREAVEWETVSEAGTAGFYLLRLHSATGKYRKVNEMLLPAMIGYPQGGRYRLIDKGAHPGETNTYLLIELENRGRKISFGPFRSTTGSGPAPVMPKNMKILKPALGSVPQVEAAESSASDFVRMPRIRTTARTALSPAGAAAPMKENRVLAAAGSGPYSANIPVTKEGIYSLDAQTISALTGISIEDVQSLIRTNGLNVRNMGKQAAYMPATDYSGIFFYGSGIDSPYTATNIYRIGKGPGLQMADAAGVSPSGMEATGFFHEKVHYERDLFTASALFTDPSADYWFWDYVEAGLQGMDSRSFTLHVDGIAPAPGKATLTADLQGATETDAPTDHHAVLALNGTVIGEGKWKGVTPVRLQVSFDRKLLRNGDNKLEVAGVLDAGVPYSIFYVNYFDLAYKRAYRAVDNQLLFKGGTNSTVTVSGFQSQHIYLFDVTNPLRPGVVSAVVEPGTAGDYSITFSPPSPGRVYYAASSAAVRPVSGGVTNIPAHLKSRLNKADYVIITPRGMKAAAGGLASYRRGQGLAAKVVTVEDIMNEFNYGIFSPEAIRSFLSYAYTGWAKPPRYVLLAGNGTYDYKDNMGFGDNLVPAIYVGTPDGLFSSDNYYADVNNDYLPEMAIGRLPVLTPDELQQAVKKIKAYEMATGAWRKDVIMATDQTDEGGNFSADSDELLSLLPLDFTVEKVSLSATAPDVARDLLLSDIGSGAFLLNYKGHAGLDQLSQDGLLTTADIANLSNGSRLPVAVAATCVIGQFDIPGYDTLGEALVLKQGGGAAAVWSPTGMSINPLARILNEAFFGAVFMEQKQVLGDAVLSALKEYGSTGSDSFMLDIYTLIGDPALRIGPQ